MMRGSRGLFICAALTGLLTMGVVGASVTAANADTSNSCSSSTGATPNCTVAAQIPDPATIEAGASASTGTPKIDIKWSTTCALHFQFASTKGDTNAASPNIVTLTLPFTDPDTCNVSVKATLETTGTVTLVVTSVSSVTPTPTATAPPPSAAPPVHLVSGYAGKCVDVRGNSSANRAKVQIWTCNGSDQAQSWTFSNGELIHNGKCLNDQRSGGNGSHVILWSCNHAANEVWTHRSHGEYVLKAKGGTLCLDDPAYATLNGTPLIVWSCKNSRNQHWSLP